MVSGSLGQHLFCPRVVAAAAAAAAAAEAGPAGLAGPVVAVTSISISISISTPMLCRSDKSVADWPRLTGLTGWPHKAACRSYVFALSLFLSFMSLLLFSYQKEKGYCNELVRLGCI
jgi:hypothetical protein